MILALLYFMHHQKARHGLANFFTVSYCLSIPGSLPFPTKKHRNSPMEVGDAREPPPFASQLPFIGTKHTISNLMRDSVPVITPITLPKTPDNI